MRKAILLKKKENHIVDGNKMILIFYFLSYNYGIKNSFAITIRDNTIPYIQHTRKSIT